MRKVLAAVFGLLVTAGLLMAGEVILVRYDKDKKEVTVKDDKDKEHTYKITDKTMFTFVTKDGDTVWVLYAGKLKDGTEFDSSAKHGNEPIEFIIGKGMVIKGWDVGVTGMQVGAKRTLVIAEGLLVYLEPEEVMSLATDLGEQPAFLWWLIDLGSPTLLKFLRRTWGNQLRSGNAPMLFAPAEGTAFFAPAGWHEAEYRAILDEAFRLQRAPKMAWLWRLLGLFASKKRREEFKRFSGVVLLHRQSRENA